MIHAVTHEISFSFEQPDRVLNSMMKVLQQRLRQAPISRTSREMVVRNALTVLIIDVSQERSHYLANLLTSIGYRAVVAANTLDAYTLFLQGEYLPLAILLGQEDGSNSLFLGRLLQHIQQRYDWEVVMLRLLLPAHTGLPDGATMRKTPDTQPSVSPADLPISAVRTGPLHSSSSWNSINEAAMEPVISPRSASLPPVSPVTPEPSNGPVEVKRPVISGQLSEQTMKREKIYLDGQSLGRFQVRSRLGGSSYSEVYRVYDRLREKDCALKAIQVDMVPFEMIRESLEEVTVFQQEMDLINPLKHAHLLPTLNCGKSYISGANFIYKLMPLCAEGSLASWMNRYVKGNSYSFKEMLPLVLQLADALQFAHNAKVTYQNFKMSNILVLEPKKKLAQLDIALVDFSVMQQDSYVPDVLSGLAYIAPERWEGTMLPASDQYGLAAISYELFTGRPPFQGASSNIMKILHTTKLPQSPTTLNAKLPSALNGILLRALAKKPSDRFASIAHFAQALQSC